jgi:hypothetical protein
LPCRRRPEPWRGHGREAYGGGVRWVVVFDASPDTSLLATTVSQQVGYGRRRCRVSSILRCFRRMFQVFYLGVSNVAMTIYTCCKRMSVSVVSYVCFMCFI